MAIESDAEVARKVDKWLDKAAAMFPAGRSSVIPMLQAAQGELGYLPGSAMEGIAKRLHMPAAEVQGIATFYAQFRFRKPGRHRVTVCRGTACHVRGSNRLLDELTATLKVGPGETSADGLFTLETVACFGSCALAPVLVVDGKVYGRQTPAIAKQTLDRVRRNGGPGKRKSKSTRNGGGCGNGRGKKCGQRKGVES